MARVKKNIITKGMSGKLGDTIVFRQRGGVTVVATLPEKEERETTEAQKQQQRKFQQAVIYAQNAMQDEDLKAEYALKAKPNRSAYHVALADFLHAPDIDDVDLSKYDGTQGSEIVIRVVDDYQVAQVIVSIFKQDGTLVEEGTAVPAGNKLDWVYTAQKSNTPLTGNKMIIKASDVPGNAAEVEQVL
jgi:hypothetical protein